MNVLPEEINDAAATLVDFALNASGAFQSLVYDGWLLGYSRGPTKHALRQPFYQSAYRYRRLGYFTFLCAAGLARSSIAAIFGPDNLTLAERQGGHLRAHAGQRAAAVLRSRRCAEEGTIMAVPDSRKVDGELRPCRSMSARARLRAADGGRDAGWRGRCEDRD